MKERVKIELDQRSSVPKYRRIINSIERSLRSGSLKKGDRIPSLNQFCREYGLSQDTVLAAYSELKARGIVTSTVGKGYFVLDDRPDTGHRVFVLFDKLTAYKEILYGSFKETLKGKGTERIFFHHNSPDIFRSLIETSMGQYTDYVIMPIADEQALNVLRLLDQSSIHMLDQGRSRFANQYPGVYQNFEEDIRSALSANEDIMEKYGRITILIRGLSGHYGEIVSGLRKFCMGRSIGLSVETDAATIKPEPGRLYIVVDDADLVTLVKKAAIAGIRLGSDIGVISYNESPLKEVIDKGIATISTDFAQMGTSIARMIASGRKDHIDNPFILIRRASV